MMADPPRSRLPEDPEYWDGLARRISDDAAGPFAAYAAGNDGWAAVLGRVAPWLVAASAAATLVLWLTLPARPSSPAFRWIESSLVPREMAGTLVSGAVPPTVDTLMVQFSPPADEEGRR